MSGVTGGISAACRSGTQNDSYVNYDSSGDLNYAQNCASTSQVHQHQPLLNALQPKLNTIHPAVLTRNRILNACDAPLKIAKILLLARAVRIDVERRARRLVVVNAPFRLQNKAGFGLPHFKSPVPQRYPPAKGIQPCR